MKKLVEKRRSFMNKDLVKKAVLDSYVTAKFLNQHNLDPVSRAKLDAELDFLIGLGRTKFKLTDKDFSDAKIDMTPLLKGDANKAFRANCATLFRLVTPKGQEHIGESLSRIIEFDDYNEG